MFQLQFDYAKGSKATLNVPFTHSTLLGSYDSILAQFNPTFAGFLGVVRNIYKRLFRLYAHLYTTHSDKVRSIGANAHLNTCFKHFMYFSEEHRLLSRDDQAPLRVLIDKMYSRDAVR